MWKKQEPQTFTIKEKTVQCQVCGHDKFHSRNTVLNQLWTAVLDLEAFSRETKSLICAECGYIHQFSKRESGLK